MAAAAIEKLPQLKSATDGLKEMRLHALTFLILILDLVIFFIVLDSHLFLTPCFSDNERSGFISLVSRYLRFVL